MILFWSIVGLMTVGALMLILRPLQWGGKMPTDDAGGSDEIALFRAQLVELDRDLEAGLIDEDNARAARLEIERRILRAAEEMGTGEGNDGAPRRSQPHPFIIGAVAMIPVVAVALYTTVGSPNLLTGVQPNADSKAVPEGPHGSMPGLEEMAQRLEAKLQGDGGTVEGWALLARTNMVLGRPGKSAKAFRKAIALAPDAALLHSGLGEALTAAAGGTVTPEAIEAFSTARAKDAADPAAVYYLALADYQRGNRRAAHDAWVALAATAPADAPWRAELQTKIEQTAAELGLEASPSDSPAPSPGPSAEQIKAAQSMGAEDRQAMIAGMVEGLAARLAENPDDAEGWRMLARSYRVLGRLEDAAHAQGQLARLHPRNAEEQLQHGLALVALEKSRGKPMGGEAQAVFERVLELDPDNPEALYYLGDAARQRGDRNAAERYWKPLLGNLPETAPKREEIETYLDKGM